MDAKYTDVKPGVFVGASPLVNVGLATLSMSNTGSSRPRWDI